MKAISPSLRCLLPALTLVTFASSAFAAPVAMSAPGTYTQDFDTLPPSGSPPTWVDDSTLASWYSARSGTGTHTVVPGDGSSNSGQLYSFGTGTATERALGSASSGTPQFIGTGILLQNTSGGTLNVNQLTYTGEQWRNGGNVTAQKLTLWYQISASPITSLTPALNTGWIAVTSGDFTSPIATATAAPLDGNAPANQVAVTATLDIAVAANEYIMFRWIDSNDAGNDHGLAVDNLTIGWASNSTPSILLAPTPASFGESAGSSASTVDVTISQAAPVGGITIALSSSDLDNSEISIPANVFIAEGQTTGSFLVGALTDTLVDGPQPVTITASLSGYTSGNTIVTVTDTTPTISLSGTPPSFLETAGANASTVTVTLSQAAPTGGLTLNLSSNDSDNSEITLPATVTVAQGDTSATFTVGALTDSLADSDQLITISATPDAPNTPGFAIGTGSVTVQNVDAPSVQFSQYFENTSVSKVLEIKNTTGSSLPLTGYYLALYTNAAAETWKNTALPIASGVSLATRSIPASGSILVGNSGNTGDGLPAYVLNYNYANGSNFTNNTLVNFNGNDSIVLYNDANSNGSLEVSEIVDALAFTNAGNEGADKSFYRISPSQGFNLTSGSKITDFASVWSVKDLLVQATLDEVLAAVPADPFYLQGAVLPISLSPTVSSFAEDAAAPASVVTVSVPYNVTANTTVTLAVTVGGSPDATEITVPASVIILSGTNSITFDVAALTDATADGSQVATVTATASGFTNGTADLTVTDVDGVSYTSWKATYFTAPELANPLVSGDDADPDGDGLKNALEYAFGTLPTTSTSAAYLPQSSISGSTLELSYLRPVDGGVPGVTYAIQVLENTDLVSGNGNWAPAVLTTDYTETISTVGTPPGTEKVTITFVAPVTVKKFGRISVSFP